MAAQVAAIMAPRYMPMKGFAGRRTGSNGGGKSLSFSLSFSFAAGSALSSAPGVAGVAGTVPGAVAPAVLARGRRRGVLGFTGAGARVVSTQTSAGSSSSALSSSGLLL
jgi:hypothetical protein